MAEQKRIYERLIALVFLGVIVFSYPVLGLFSKKIFFCGVPLLYIYIFSLWFFFIMLLALVLRKRSSPISKPDPGP